jgi:hypothetical protein
MVLVTKQLTTDILEIKLELERGLVINVFIRVQVLRKYVRTF